MHADTIDSVSDLVHRARGAHATVADQQAAFALLVGRFQAMAYATALEASDDMESARDACQEAFLVAWRTLPQLREPVAFGGWLKRLVRTQCARARTHRHRSADVVDRMQSADRSDVRLASDPHELASRRETLRCILRAMDDLTPEEREAVTLFYFLGEPLKVIAPALGLSVGTIGKRLYTGRLRLRRQLPRSVAGRFLATAPTPAFTQRVRAGILDEFVGEYRFESRPDHKVTIRREGDVLGSQAGGQWSVLASCKPDTLVSTTFDGEGRFVRDRHGHVSHFIYYEFGRRLGVARKLAPQDAALDDRSATRGSRNSS